MRKTLVIAVREYRAAVRSKAFVITLVAMPVLMAGAILIQVFLKDKVDTRDTHYAVVDRSGQFAQVLEQASVAYNENETFEGAGDDRKKVKPSIVLEMIDPAEIGEPPESTLKLSDRVRKKQLQGFLEIDADILTNASQNELTYYSLNPMDNSFRRWAVRVINQAVQRKRAESEGVDTAVLQRVMRAVTVQSLGLVERDAETGRISEPEDANPMAHMFVPMGLMMLVFMAVMVGATPLMQAVMEEKQARISEVLLGSVQPFELMFGKLAGIVAVTLTTMFLYIVGAYLTLEYLGYADRFPPLRIILWLALFQTLAVLMYGALFIAIGAAVTDMREAQSAMMPVMIFAMSPMFVWFHVVREPDSTMSVVMSLFPPATPMLMLLRLASPLDIPIWQPILGSLLVLLSTIFCIYAAGRIFRVGILLQGEAASLKRMAGWVFRG